MNVLGLLAKESRAFPDKKPYQFPNNHKSNHIVHTIGKTIWIIK